jgi:cation diffusion facilitator family transporter
MAVNQERRMNDQNRKDRFASDDHSHPDDAHDHEHNHDHPHDDFANSHGGHSVATHLHDDRDHEHDHDYTILRSGSSAIAHDDHAHGEHGHDHDRSGGLSGLLGALFHTHSHATSRTDQALEGSERGICALKISLGGLFATAVFQLVIVMISGSAALLADTIHNFADALTAVPLWIAFVIGRRPPTRRYTYGFRRAEDLAGVFIVLVMLASAVLAGWESYRKLIAPEPIQNLGWVMAAAVIGFLGNELVAIFRIRVGREIGSAALEADGYHARTDGLTSLAVLLGALAVWAGYPLADPIVGLLITIPILLVVRDASKAVWERLMDAVDPALVDSVESNARKVDGALAIHDVRIRWLGHNLEAELYAEVDSQLSTADSHAISQEIEHKLLHAIPQLERVIVHIDPVGPDGADFHAATAHHRAKD